MTSRNHGRSAKVRVSSTGSRWVMARSVQDCFHQPTRYSSRPLFRAANDVADLVAGQGEKSRTVDRAERSPPPLPSLKDAGVRTELSLGDARAEVAILARKGRDTGAVRCERGTAFADGGYAAAIRFPSRSSRREIRPIPVQPNPLAERTAVAGETSLEMAWTRVPERQRRCSRQTRPGIRDASH